MNDYVGAAGPRRQVDEVYVGIPVQAAVAAGDTIDIEVKVKDKFQARRLVLEAATASAFRIITLTIGRVSQNNGTGPVPGTAFQHDSTFRLKGEIVDPSVGIEMRVQNVSGAAADFAGAFFGPALGV